eukprot:PLAT8470.2.p1 GENE.PLAT8470.2~~PLAT8470.2.p1  ORF type:complete len:334 (+),score=61.36 PLAT8470.2:62-1063(+)
MQVPMRATSDSASAIRSLLIRSTGHDSLPALLVLSTVQLICGCLCFLFLLYLWRYAPANSLKVVKQLVIGKREWAIYLRDYSDELKARLLRELRTQLSDDEELLWHGFEDREAMQEDATLRVARNENEIQVRRMHNVEQVINLVFNILSPAIMILSSSVTLYVSRFTPVYILMFWSMSFGVSVLLLLVCWRAYRRECDQLSVIYSQKTVFALTDRRAIAYHYDVALGRSVKALSTTYSSMTGLTVANDVSIFYDLDSSATDGRFTFDASETADSVPGGGFPNYAGFRFIPHELSHVEALLREKMTAAGVSTHPLPPPAEEVVKAGTWGSFNPK